jgi:hypothetical protein
VSFWLPERRIRSSGRRCSDSLPRCDGISPYGEIPIGSYYGWMLRLVEQFECELQDAGLIPGSGDDREVGISRGVSTRGICELGMVQQVVGFRTELQMDGVFDGQFLEERSIDIIETGTPGLF